MRVFSKTSHRIANGCNVSFLGLRRARLPSLSIHKIHGIVSVPLSEIFFSISHVLRIAHINETTRSNVRPKSENRRVSVGELRVLTRPATPKPGGCWARQPLHRVQISGSILGIRQNGQVFTVPLKRHLWAHWQSDDSGHALE